MKRIKTAFLVVVGLWCSFGGVLAQTGSIRHVKGLCVIADFADRKLEDVQGLGVRTEGEIRGILNDMEAHWAWMSVNTRFYTWDTVRVTLDQNFREDAFPDAWEFRRAVGQKVRQAVNPDDYDVNKDGIMDTVFIVVSGHDDLPLWINSEINRLALYQMEGMDCFAEGQAGYAVRWQSTGVFNHETSHCRVNGFQADVYGDTDTLNYLTLMASGWEKPPSGFSAFERCNMGWVVPEVVKDTRKGVHLRAAEYHLEAIKIPTPVPHEYYLIEFRDKPESGFGSDTRIPDHRGLAIYHINLSRTMLDNNGIPPMIPVEAPDGQPDYGTTPDTTDFWYPGNPVMRGAFEARPDYNPNEVYFSLGNMSFTDQGIRFDIEFHKGTPPPLPQSITPVYRFHRSDTNTHFFTAIEGEKDTILQQFPADIWTLEGVSHHVMAGQEDGSFPVYRLYNRWTQSHFYTINEA